MVRAGARWRGTPPVFTASQGTDQPPRDPRDDRLPLDELPPEERLPDEPDDEPPDRTEPELPELREPPPLERTLLPLDERGGELERVSVLRDGGGDEDPLDRTPCERLPELLREPDDRTPCDPRLEELPDDRTVDLEEAGGALLPVCVRDPR